MTGVQTCALPIYVAGSGNQASSSDSHSVNLIDPAITVTKTGPAIAEVGDTITYTIGFTNTGIGDLENCTGNDTVIGSVVNDTLDGGTGNDTLNGNDGDDRLYGHIGEEVRLGGPGADTLDGGGGSAWRAGGAASVARKRRISSSGESRSRAARCSGVSSWKFCGSRSHSNSSSVTSSSPSTP